MKKTILLLLSTLCLTLFFCTPAVAAEDSIPKDVVISVGTADSGLSADISKEIGESISEAFNLSVNSFVAGFISDVVSVVDNILVDMLDCVFHVEHLFQSENIALFSNGMLSDLYDFLYTVASALVGLKFLLKGTNIYILGRGGDPDASPKDMLTGVGQAIVIMVGFPFLYEKGVDIFLFFASGIMGRLGSAQGTTALLGWAAKILNTGAILIILVIVFFIMAIVLWVKLMVQGFELLVMRLGVPFAAQGLIDSDMALWKNYYQYFLKLGFTVIIQAALMSVAFRMILTVTSLVQIKRIIGAIAALALAISTPKLLQQWLVPQGAGGGISQKAYSVAMVCRAARMLTL